MALRFVPDAQDCPTAKVAVTIAIAPDLGPQEPRRWALNLKAVTALNLLISSLTDYDNANKSSMAIRAPATVSVSCSRRATSACR